MTRLELGTGACTLMMLALGTACSEDETTSSTTGQAGSGATPTGTGASGGGGPVGGAGGEPMGGAGGSGGAAQGIAQRYPGDVGIEGDPDVIFADDFESYGQPSDLWNRWDTMSAPGEIAVGEAEAP